MINVHFNGEMVRCPDAKANYVRTVQRRETNRLCGFGIPEDLCKTKAHWIMQEPKIRCNCKCPLADADSEEIIDGINWKHYVCPRAQKRYIAAITPKKFKFDNKTKRKLASAAHWMWKESPHKSIFITLTFPNFKNHEITEREANECFTLFAKNLKNSYDCTDYIATRERGETNDRLHFHLACAIPFVQFSDLNAAWCHAIQDYCDFSNNAVQSRAGNRIINNPIRAMRYMCKYMEKCKGTSDSRIYFISNNTLKKAFAIRGESFNLSDVIQKFKSVKSLQFDYVTILYITDYKEYKQFCNEFLYPLFECSVNSS